MGSSLTPMREDDEDMMSRGRISDSWMSSTPLGSAIDGREFFQAIAQEKTDKARAVGKNAASMRVILQHGRNAAASATYRELQMRGIRKQTAPARQQNDDE